MNPFFFILLTVIATVSSQVFFKLAVKNIALAEKPLLSVDILFNPMVLVGLVFSIVSILSWLVALNRLSLSLAYPFMSLTFPLVLVASNIFLGESISPLRWLGIFIIMVGLCFVSYFE
jgi:drug/metabolite transporter (DMT)-like permease